MGAPAQIVSRSWRAFWMVCTGAPTERENENGARHLHTPSQIHVLATHCTRCLVRGSLLAGGRAHANCVTVMEGVFDRGRKRRENGDPARCNRVPSQTYMFHTLCTRCGVLRARLDCESARTTSVTVTKTRDKLTSAAVDPKDPHKNPRAMSQSGV